MVRKQKLDQDQRRVRRRKEIVTVRRRKIVIKQRKMVLGILKKILQKNRSW